ncbi:MAG: hypothetical protein M3Y56_03620, partial [Armatimonadota bacterium]|nr:hypothetical protein [Armatimonadota bacterium]
MMVVPGKAITIIIGLLEAVASYIIIPVHPSLMPGLNPQSRLNSITRSYRYGPGSEVKSVPPAGKGAGLGRNLR